jgi:hypothetical protein
MPFHELASHRYSGDAAHATSRTFFAVNFHVSVGPLDFGRAAPERISSSVTMFTGVAEPFAFASRAISVDVSTAVGFIKVPVLATM